MSTESIATTPQLSEEGRMVLRALTPPAVSLQVAVEYAELPEMTVKVTLEKLVEAGLVQRVGMDEPYRDEPGYELTRRGYSVIGPRYPES